MVREEGAVGKEGSLVSEAAEDGGDGGEGDSILVLRFKNGVGGGGSSVVLPLSMEDVFGCGSIAFFFYFFSQGCVWSSLKLRKPIWGFLVYRPKLVL